MIFWANFDLFFDVGLEWAERWAWVWGKRRQHKGVSTFAAAVRNSANPAHTHLVMEAQEIGVARVRWRRRLPARRIHGGVEFPAHATAARICFSATAATTKR